MGRSRQGARTTKAPAPPTSPVTISLGNKWWPALVLIVAGLLAYLNSLPAPFILDDDGSIVRNPFIKSLWPLSQAMRAPLQSAFAGRPVASLSLAISYAFGGLTPETFRAWNIAVLIASALVLFGIVRRTCRRVGGEAAATADLVAGGAALIWLLHPLQTEVVDYITQRTESLMGLFYLLTLYAAARAIDEPLRARRWSVLAVITCALGMACKESMVTAPVMVLLYDFVFGARSFKEALRQRAALYGGLAACWLLLLILNLDSPRSGSAGFSTATPAATYLLNQAVMIVTYLKLSIWPYPLVLDYGRTQPIALVSALPYLLVVVAVMVAVATAWRRHRVLAFLGTWFFITLAPSSSVIPIATEVGAERRMYLPLAAIAILFVLAVRKLASRSAAVVVAVSALVLGGLTIARNNEYRDPIGIWQTVLDRHPHGRAHYNLAIALKNAGRVDEAIAHYREGLPDEPAGYYALGFEAGQAGRYAEAAEQLQEFVRLRPADEMTPKAWFLLGDAMRHLNRPAEAERAYNEALRMVPGYADARGALADLLFAEKRFADAIPAYRDYLALMPDSVNAHHSLGLALVASHQEAAAVGEFEKAVGLRPTDPGLRMSLGNALAATAQLDRAIASYREGLKLAPDDGMMTSALALTLALNGNRDESLALFNRALRLEPNNPDIQSDYAAAREHWRK